MSMPSPIGMARAAASPRSFEILVISRAASTPTLVLADYWRKAGRRVIYDCDDAVYLIRNPGFARFEEMVKRASLTFAGSHELHLRLSGLSSSVQLVPTPVDTHLFNPRWRAVSYSRLKDDLVTIGWMGKASVAIEELRLMVPVLRELGRSLGGKRVRFSLFSALDSQDARTLFSHIPGVEFDPGPQVWTKFEEVPRHISKFDISIMPLRDTIWNRSKCATKLLETMAMGIPVVASDVGENKYVVRHGQNGFLAGNTEEFVSNLTALIEDRYLRRTMGDAGRELVVSDYSLERISKAYANALEDSIRR